MTLQNQQPIEIRIVKLLRHIFKWKKKKYPTFSLRSKTKTKMIDKKIIFIDDYCICFILHWCLLFFFISLKFSLVIFIQHTSIDVQPAIFDSCKRWFFALDGHYNWIFFLYALSFDACEACHSWVLLWTIAMVRNANGSVAWKPFTKLIATKRNHLRYTVCIHLHF